MIKMPHRNVTRFFIPLIDVLILLFCIFLLMDFNAESKADAQGEMVDDQSDKIEQLDADLRKRTKELHKFEELRPQLEKMDELLKRIAELEKANQQNLQQRAFFRVIDIDGNDGKISYYEDTTETVTKIDSDKSAELLIEKHRNQAMNREVYYYFMWPRPFLNRPNQGDLKRYRQWFANAANSLAEK